MSWNKQLEQFALSCAFYESARLLAHYILNRAKKNEVCEIEIDLHLFNRWVKPYRVHGEYHRKTVTNAIAFLDEHSQGMFTITKKYSSWIYKVLVRPLSLVLKMQVAKCASTPKLNRGNPMFSDEHKEKVLLQQQQDISKINNLLLDVGLKYDSNALTRIWRLAGKKIEPVVKAIELMLYRHSSGNVPKPHGFIIQCLTEGWQKGFDIYYEPQLPKFNSLAEIGDFVSGLCNKQRLRHQT